MPAAAPILIPTDFVKKWAIRFADNEFQRITEGTFREFAVDIAATFGVQVVNVPAFQPGLPYQDGYLVRFTPAAGKESFFYSLQAGILPEPTTDPADTYWRLVPGPVAAVALSQELTLDQARAIEGLLVVAGREYLIACGPDTNDQPQLVTVRGVSGYKFDVQGTLEVAGVLTPIEAFDVQAGSWQVRSTAAQVLADANVYTDSQLVWRFIGNPWDNNISQGYFSGTNNLGDATDMLFGAYAFNCSFKPGAYSSRIGAFANTCIARERFAFNVIGDYLSGLVVGQDFGHNTLGNYVANVSAGNNCSFNTFGDNVNGASLGIGVTFCTIGNGCRGVILGDGCEHVEVYNCYDQFTVPAGTKNAVYRNNKLVDPNGGGGGNGTVTSVNGVGPDPATGNVQIPVAGSVAQLSGSVVKFTQEGEYPTVQNGTFTVDVAGAVLGVVVRVRLGLSASEPALDGMNFKALGNNKYVAGRPFLYSFCVAPENTIEYYITPLS